MSESDIVIRVEGLSKKYALHHEQSEHYTALPDEVARQAKAAAQPVHTAGPAAQGPATT